MIQLRPRVLWTPQPYLVFSKFPQGAWLYHRGASWLHQRFHVRSAMREYERPSMQEYEVGFRLVLVKEQSNEL